MSQTMGRSVAPFLVDLAVTRKVAPELGGRYSPTLQVWTIDDEGVVPVVEASNIRHGSRMPGKCDAEHGREASLLAELATKTDVKQESDDAPYGAGLLELETKTAAQIESDDQDPALF